MSASTVVIIGAVRVIVIYHLFCLHVIALLYRPMVLTNATNQTLQNMLVKYTHEKKAVWDDFLDTCVYAYNTSVHETTAFTPFELMFGRRAVLPIDLEIDKCDPTDILEQQQQQQQNPEDNVSITAIEQMMHHRQ